MEYDGIHIDPELLPWAGAGGYLNSGDLLQEGKRQQSGLKHVWELYWGLGVSGTGNSMAIQRLYAEGCLDGSMPDWKGRWQCSEADFK